MSEERKLLVDAEAAKLAARYMPDTVPAGTHRRVVMALTPQPEGGEAVEMEKDGGRWVKIVPAEDSAVLVAALETEIARLWKRVEQRNANRIYCTHCGKPAPCDSCEAYATMCDAAADDLSAALTALGPEREVLRHGLAEAALVLRTECGLMVAERDALRAEVEAALDVLQPSMRESGLVDACRQRMQAYLVEKDNIAKALAKLDEAHALAQERGERMAKAEAEVHRLRRVLRGEDSIANEQMARVLRGPCDTPLGSCGGCNDFGRPYLLAAGRAVGVVDEPEEGK